VARNIIFTPKAAKPPPMYSQAVKAAGSRPIRLLAKGRNCQRASRA